MIIGLGDEADAAICYNLNTFSDRFQALFEKKIDFSFNGKFSDNLFSKPNNPKSCIRIQCLPLTGTVVVKKMRRTGCR